MSITKHIVLGLTVIAAFSAVSLVGTQKAEAAGFSYISGFGSSVTIYSGTPYHGSSLHYDRVYHPTSVHWTPSRGLHTHGHVDYVPHPTIHASGHLHDIHLHDDHDRLRRRFDHGYGFYR